jgi:hypothetical protein
LTDSDFIWRQRTRYPYGKAVLARVKRAHVGKNGGASTTTGQELLTELPGGRALGY